MDPHPPGWHPKLCKWREEESSSMQFLLLSRLRSRCRQLCKAPTALLPCHGEQLAYNELE